MKKKRRERELLEVPLRRWPRGHGAEIGFDEGAKLRCFERARIELGGSVRRIKGFGSKRTQPVAPKITATRVMLEHGFRTSGA
ncbi:MAG: hypothetical protein IPK15_01250 [Verrucomicrobia bacterium]|nr:hypothetical protein [Verrucomicrobiota bacterium]